MSPIVQVCIVIVTGAVVVLAFLASRLMIRMDAMTKTLEVGFLKLEEILEDVRQTSQRVRNVMDVADDAALSVRRAASRLEGLVDHATSVGWAAIDTIERPVHRAAAVWKGIRAGASYVLSRWTRGNSNDPTTPKGVTYE